MFIRGARAICGLMAAALISLAASPARAADGDLRCTMTFTMAGWSVFYQTAAGHGTIQCSNGESMPVRVSAKGGGVTFGKSVETGHGEFSRVARMKDLLGSYVTANAHAGTGKSSTRVQIMTRQGITLKLTAKGQGWNLGFGFGALKIER